MGKYLLFFVTCILIAGCSSRPRLRIFTDPALRQATDSLVVQLGKEFPGTYEIDILERSSPVLISRMMLGDVPDILLYSTASLPNPRGGMDPAMKTQMLGSDTLCMCKPENNPGTGRIGVPPEDIIPGQMLTPFLSGMPETSLLVADFYPQLGQFLQDGWVDGIISWKSTCRKWHGIPDSLVEVPATGIYRIGIFSHDSAIQQYFQPD